MSALAKFLLQNGKRVGGCDRELSPQILKLQKLGFCLEKEEDINAIISYQVIVYTDAIMHNHPLLIAALNSKKTVFSRGVFLYEVSRCFTNVIAIAGSHGKTTCTAMLAHVYHCAKIPFACHIGGEDLLFDNFFQSGWQTFITEACEYKKNYLHLRPNIAVMLNQGNDHMECYGTPETLRLCNQKFLQSAEKAIVRYGEFNGGITFGLDVRADYFADKIHKKEGKYTFNLCKKAKHMGQISLSVAGKHNVFNALAVYAVADSMGIQHRYIVRGLSDFKGVKRRFERMPNYYGATCIADYAHHPDEILATLKTARVITKGKIYVIFQPHTYSRTKNLFKQFVSALKNQKKLLIYRTYAAREYYDDAGSAYTLSLAIKNSRYADGVQDIKDFLTDVTVDDCILFLGAGDIYDIAWQVVKNQ